MPVNLAANTGPMGRFIWTNVSGAGTWELTDLEKSNRHIWCVEFISEVAGIQLRILKQKTGTIHLVYTPDPDIEDDSLIFERKSTNEVVKRA